MLTFALRRVLLAIPTLLLYEASIFAVQMVEKKMADKKAEDEAADAAS